MPNVRSVTPNDPANFTPELGNYKTLQPFRYWCQKVLPLVYDDSLSYYELLCKVVDYLNKAMEDVETLHGDVTNLHTAYEELQSYVNNYFSTLDVQEEINHKLDNMANSGELYEIIRRYTDPIVNEQNEKINVLKSRMDTFASLPNGSTSGDAELTDIRVGFNGNVYPSAGNAVRAQVGELYSDIEDTKSLIVSGENLFNVDTISALGEWCNYANGSFESTSYVTNYRHSDFIPCKANTSYARRYNTGTLGTVFFDKYKNYISGVQTDVFVTPENCSYMVANVSTTINIDSFMIIESKEVINTFAPFIPYINKLKYGEDYLTRSEAEKYSINEVITVGTSGDFKTIKEGFEYAVANDKIVVIEPGTYDLVAEGISGGGYILPKKIYGYGATLLCNLSEEDWDLSPLNTNWRYNSFEVYGVTIICNNCRYCIHDEMGAKTSGYYHNVFKDLTLIHNGNKSDVLIAPQCIGGGLGNHGDILIENCVMQCNYPYDVTYHSSFTGAQTENSTVLCKDCDISHSININAIGDSTEFMNVMRVTNCLCGTLPLNEIKTNAKSITWNNVVK